jgi:hypothetical protein
VVSRERAPHISPFVLPDAQDFQEPAHGDVAGVLSVIERHFGLDLLHAPPRERVPAIESRWNLDSSYFAGQFHVNPRSLTGRITPKTGRAPGTATDPFRIVGSGINGSEMEKHEYKGRSRALRAQNQGTSALRIVDYPVRPHPLSTNAGTPDQCQYWIRRGWRGTEPPNSPYSVTFARVLPLGGSVSSGSVQSKLLYFNSLP